MENIMHFLKDETNIKYDKLNDSPESIIQAIGINVLKNELGVVDTLSFLEKYDNGGYGNYTEEKYNKEDERLTKDKILEMFNLG